MILELRRNLLIIIIIYSQIENNKKLTHYKEKNKKKLDNDNPTKYDCICRHTPLYLGFLILDCFQNFTLNI